MKIDGTFFLLSYYPFAYPLLYLSAIRSLDNNDDVKAIEAMGKHILGPKAAATAIGSVYFGRAYYKMRCVAVKNTDPCSSATAMPAISSFLYFYCIFLYLTE